MPNDREQAGAFCQQLRVVASVTAVHRGRLVVLRCTRRNGVVTVYVARGAVRHTAFASWN